VAEPALSPVWIRCGELQRLFQGTIEALEVESFIRFEDAADADHGGSWIVWTSTTYETTRAGICDQNPTLWHFLTESQHGYAGRLARLLTLMLESKETVFVGVQVHRFALLRGDFPSGPVAKASQ
jgi:hypothetical protein